MTFYDKRGWRVELTLRFWNRQDLDQSRLGDQKAQIHGQARDNAIGQDIGNIGRNRLRIGIGQIKQRCDNPLRLTDFCYAIRILGLSRGSGVPATRSVARQALSSLPSK